MTRQLLGLRAAQPLHQLPALGLLTALPSQLAVDAVERDLMTNEGQPVLEVMYLPSGRADLTHEAGGCDLSVDLG